jgi:hypothetical protein
VNEIPLRGGLSKFPPVPPFPALCLGNAYILNSLNQSLPDANTYTWNPGHVVNRSPSHPAKKGGTYTMRVENPGGCLAQGRQNVTFKPTPTARITGRTVYCAGDTVKLSGNTGSGNMYYWHYANSYSPISTAPNIKLNLPAGTYPIVLEVYGTQCNASDTVEIRVDTAPRPPVLQFANANRCVPPVVLGSALDNNLYWSVGSYGRTAPVYTPGWVSAYHIDFSSGCKSGKDSIFVDPSPDFDALLTGCYRVCEGAFTATLPVYSFMPSILDPQWKWNWQGNNILSGNGSMLMLPVPGPGLYELDVSYGQNCQATSPVLEIRPKETCPCDGIDVTPLEIACVPNGCNPYIKVAVRICNNGRDYFNPSDFHTHSVHHILGYSPANLSVAPGRCEIFYFDVEIADFSALPVEFVLLDEERKCEKKFVIDFDPEDCIECVRDLTFEKMWFNENLSTPHQNSYFEFLFDLPPGTTSLHSFWSDPNYVVNAFNYGNRLHGLYMINFGELTQMAERNGNVCFHAVVCLDDRVLCLLTFCIPARKVLDMVPRDYRSASAAAPSEDASAEWENRKDNAEAQKPYLAPNPACDEVEVLGIDPGQVKEIRVLDMNGKEVQKTEGSHRFAVSGIPAATYIVRVVTMENKAHYLKLVKQ